MHRDYMARQTNRIFMEEIKQTNQLGSEEQYMMEALVAANIRLVISIAKQFQNCGLSLIELIGKGKSGLTRAYKGFDESRGYDFIDYATWHIRQSMVRAIVENQPKRPTPLNKIGLLMKTPQSVLKPDHFFLREPGIRELGSIKVFRTKITKDAPMVNS